jgi:uncharacterized protein YecT (DUF1311 family)
MNNTSSQRIIGTLLLVCFLAALCSPAGAALPSFDCTRAKASFEKAICSDAGLAALDLALDRAYRAALSRLRPDDATALRSDQRAFSSENADLYDFVEQELWKKAAEPHEKQPAKAKLALRQRLSERLDFFKALDIARQDPIGLWVAHNARLLVSAGTATVVGAGQTVVLEGYKFAFLDDRFATCDFGSFRTAADPVNGSHTGNGPNQVKDGKIVLDASHYAERKGILLEIGPPEQPDEGSTPTADYCISKVHSPATVMFPVKTAAALLPVKPGTGLPR